MRRKTININSLTELKELCNKIGVTVEVIPMFRKNYLSVGFDPHLNTMWVEYTTPTLEKRAVRAALRELALQRLVPEK